MSNSYSLEDLKADVEKEFAPVTLTYGRETFKLRHLFRLTDDERKTVFDTLDAIKAEAGSEDQEISIEALSKLSDAVWAMLRALPEDGKGGKLVEVLGGDLAIGIKIVNLYTEGTQLGEADTSPN